MEHKDESDLGKFRLQQFEALAQVTCRIFGAVDLRELSMLPPPNRRPLPIQDRAFHLAVIEVSEELQCLLALLACELVWPDV